MQTRIEDNEIVIQVPFFLNHLPKAAGARWHPSSKTWKAKLNKLAAAAVVANFPPEEVDPAILSLLGDKITVPPLSVDPNAMLAGTILRERQMEAVHKAWPNLGYALFHVMGAGKTITTITLANLRRTHNLIDRMLIVCPTSVKGVWKKEFGRFSALPVAVQVLEAGKSIAPFEEFPVLVVGVEALSQGGAFNIAMDFVSGGRCLSVVDESSRIKNHNKNRTERCWELGEESVSRMILTGTNVTQGVQDLYSQMRFVDPAIIGELSYYGFRNRYCVMGGFGNKKIVGYTNLATLFNRIRPFCDVVRKDDMKDLPPKMYQVRDVKASPEQVRACKELARTMKTEIGDKMLSVQNALEAMLRFQQIAGGFDHEGHPLSSNPKLTELLALLEEFDGKAIIWCRYLPEIAAVSEALDEAYPGTVLTMHGGVPASERQPMVDEFQTDPRRRFFVANQSTGGIGLTLTAATLSVYYSNTFSLEDRLQSEDRNHRIGQHNAVLYIDLISDLKVDQLVMAALLQKKTLASYVGNELRIDDLA